jgi:hypothetical protein
MLSFWGARRCSVVEHHQLMYYDRSLQCIFELFFTRRGDGQTGKKQCQSRDTHPKCTNYWVLFFRNAQHEWVDLPTDTEELFFKMYKASWKEAKLTGESVEQSTQPPRQRWVDWVQRWLDQNTDQFAKSWRVP